MQPGTRPGRLLGMTTNTLRRGAVALAVLIAGLATAAPAADATPVSSSTASSRTQASSLGPDFSRTVTAERAVPRTKLTLAIADCEGCEVGLTQARWDRSAKWGVRTWDSKQKLVADGTVTFRVPTKRTRGMSMTVVAPWEGHTGYLATVVFRYGGKRPGTEVGFGEARAKTMGTACWAGTTAREVTLPVTVRKVWVQGVRHRVRGSIAYANTTQDWMVPMREVWDGVMGSQDVNVCGEPKR